MPMTFDPDLIAVHFHNTEHLYGYRFYITVSIIDSVLTVQLRF